MSAKVKAYTRKQLHRAAKARRMEEAAEGRMDRKEAQYMERQLRKIEAVFKGCELR